MSQRIPPSPPAAPEVEQIPRTPRAPASEWEKFITSFGYAFRGLWYAVRTQRNMRVHVTAALLVIAAGILLRVSALEFAMLFIAITSVFIAEMFNTVIELCVDLASPNYHPLARIAKDVAAGAVLLGAMLSVVIGLFVLGPHLWQIVMHLLLHK